MNALFQSLVACTFADGAPNIISAYCYLTAWKQYRAEIQDHQRNAGGIQ